MDNGKILVTGTAGFIGFHFAERLIAEGWDIVGLDNINDYYDISLKYARLKESGIYKEKIKYNKLIISQKYDKYRFIKLNLEDKDNILNLFKEEKFDYVVNLAAQAGVIYSIENPYAYLDSNIYGFLNILEGCRQFPVKHLIYASSSSVYGSNTKIPFCERDKTDTPISLYAATKKSNELMAYTYSHLFNIPTTGLRFFTVYGPWGRPDMALFIFAKAIIHGDEIFVFNNGEMKRDFTYIDDIIESLFRLLNITSNKYRLFNIGNNSPVLLMDFIKLIGKALGKKAKIKFLPIRQGEVPETYANIDEIVTEIQFKPKFNLKEGLDPYFKWFLSYYSQD